MPKIKITSANRTQQNNVINKCRNWGAGARDGDYGPVVGKTAIVINTQLGNIPAIQLSRVDFTPTKKPYSQVINYKDFMNLDVCPWDVNAGTVADEAPSVAQSVVLAVAAVEVEVGICAQDTLKVKSCDIIVQESIGFKTYGLPFLIDNGVEVTIHNDEAYILDVKNNGASKLTPDAAAEKAKASILAGDKDVWTRYAKTFDLVGECVLVKADPNADDAEDTPPGAE